MLDFGFWIMSSKRERNIEREVKEKQKDFLLFRERERGMEGKKKRR